MPSISPLSSPPFFLPHQPQYAFFSCPFFIFVFPLTTFFFFFFHLPFGLLFFTDAVLFEATQDKKKFPLSRCCPGIFYLYNMSRYVSDVRVWAVILERSCCSGEKRKPSINSHVHVLDLLAPMFRVEVSGWRPPVRSQQLGAFLRSESMCIFFMP